MDMIVLKNVEKSFKVYSDRPVTLKERVLFKGRRKHKLNRVLKGIDITIERGEVVGLIGRNGCGKSTTLKLMTRILYPEKGNVIVNGRVSSLLELGAGFHPDLSGRDNIYANAAVFGLTKKQVDARLSSIIAFSELEEYIDNPVRTYSSGMYMRLAFSVAINVDAEVLLIDEILAVGDANFQSKCYRRLHELKEKDITIVIVTHDTGVVQSFCNRAIWLNEGEVMADGNQVEVVDQYLKYMSERQIERMRREEEGLTAEVISTQEEYEDDEEDWTSAPQSANHFGNGDVEITDAFMTDDQGVKTNIVHGGRNAAIHIQYKIHRPCKGYIFGMGFSTLDDLCIYGNNTKLDHLPVKDIPKTGEVVFAIDKLPLLSGEYKMNVSVEDQNETELDFYRCYLVVTVVADDRSPGVARIPHSWVLPAGTGDTDGKN